MDTHTQKQRNRTERDLALQAVVDALLEVFFQKAVADGSEKSRREIKKRWSDFVNFCNKYQNNGDYAVVFISLLREKKSNVTKEELNMVHSMYFKFRNNPRIKDEVALFLLEKVAKPSVRSFMNSHPTMTAVFRDPKGGYYEELINTAWASAFDSFILFDPSSGNSYYTFAFKRVYGDIQKEVYRTLMIAGQTFTKNTEENEEVINKEPLKLDEVSTKKKATYRPDFYEVVSTADLIGQSSSKQDNSDKTFEEELASDLNELERYFEEDKRNIAKYFKIASAYLPVQIVAAVISYYSLNRSSMDLERYVGISRQRLTLLFRKIKEEYLKVLMAEKRD